MNEAMNSVELDLGRVKGSQSYMGVADSPEEITAAMTAENVIAVEGDGYLCVVSGNVYQYKKFFTGHQWVKMGCIKGARGEDFSVKKVYPSVAAMNAGFATDGLPEGAFVMIDTGDVEDPDTAKLYVKGAERYEFVTDFSGAQGIQGIGVSTLEITPGATESDGQNYTITVTLTDDRTYALPFKVQKGPKGDPPELSLVNGELYATYNGGIGIEDFTDVNGAKNYIGKNVNLAVSEGTHILTNCTGRVTVSGNTAKVYVSNSPGLSVEGVTATNWRNVKVDGVAEYVYLNSKTKINVSDKSNLSNVSVYNFEGELRTGDQVNIVISHEIPNYCDMGRIDVPYAGTYYCYNIRNANFSETGRVYALFLQGGEVLFANGSGGIRDTEEIYIEYFALRTNAKMERR